MQIKTLLLAAAAACASAIPVAVSVQAEAEAGAGCAAPNRPTPTLPKTGGPSDLPNPPEGTKLLHIALGLGIQNYTCATVGGTAAATGALAMLYDATHLYPGQSYSSLSADEFNALPAKVVNSQPVPLHFNPSPEGRADPKHPGATSDPWTAETPLIADGRPLPFLGHHFFNSAGVPTFVLDNGKINLLSKKIASADAPASADPGPDKTGAVSWLYLGNNPGSVGAKYVYRVLTAGGNSHGCAVGTGGDSTSYSATYWFYG